MMMITISLSLALVLLGFNVSSAERAPLFQQGQVVKRTGCTGTTKAQKSACRVLRSQKFNIDLINYSNNSDYNHLFIAAAERWEEIITEDTIPGTKNYLEVDAFDGIFGESPYLGPIDDLVIGFQMMGDDAFQSKTNAGRSAAIYFNHPDPERMTPPIFPMSGVMVFNIDAFARYNATETDILLLILHEMGHILGIGSEPWIRGCTPNCINIKGEDFSNFTLGTDGYYCARAHNAYKKLGIVGRYRNKKRMLLVNQLGALGSICTHWAKESFNVPGVTSELMTPFFENNVSQPISTVTLGALEDIGYSVDYSKADDFPQEARGKRHLLENANNNGTAKFKYPLSPDTTFSTLDWMTDLRIAPKYVSLDEVRRRA